MKRAFSITFHNANNYGAVLQAYALQQVLAKKYETAIVDYDNPQIAKGYKLFGFLSGNLNPKQFAKDVLNFKKEFTRNRNFDKFRENIKVSQKITSADELSFLNADALIVGSDQIWNPDMTSGVDDVYTLNCNLPDCKKISYAASSGSKEAFKKCQSEYLDIIEKFDSISVRETELKEILDKNTTKKVDVVLDPSLLLSKEEWSELAGDTPIIKEKYIFVYCGDEPDYFYDIVNDCAAKNDATIVHFGRRDTKNKFKYRKKSMYEVGPAEFVNLVKFSTYVITASFHGTALGILLNKSPIIVLNKYQDRLKTLMKTAGMTYRIADSLESYQAFDDEKIDWDTVNRILKTEREKSIKWLYGAIDGGKKK